MTNPSNELTKKTFESRPSWIRVKAPVSQNFRETQELLKGLSLNTVCEEAACPNIGECWKEKHATFMILGSVCTRACAFCNVATGTPDLLDPHEPEKVAEACQRLGLKHIVITSVDRDDLPDGGAQHFVQTIASIRKKVPQATIEILTPDFLRKKDVLPSLVTARPDVFNHNLETVPRLYPTVRPGARYFNSLQLLSDVKKQDSSLFTKSGLMVGLGETKAEIYQVMDDLRAAEVDFITIGQYLRPTQKHHPVERYVHPDEFQEYATMARGKGFLMVAASPLTRSSYHAGEDFQKLRESRLAQKA